MRGVDITSGQMVEFTEPPVRVERGSDNTPAIPFAGLERIEVDLLDDMAAMDRLPLQLRRLVDNSPFQWSAQQAETLWTSWQRKGGSVSSLCAWLDKTMAAKARQVEGKF